MTAWPSTKARRVYAALIKVGWQMKRQSASHCTRTRTRTRRGWPDFVFAFHDSDEIGPRMQVRVARQTGLRPQDL